MGFSAATEHLAASAGVLNQKLTNGELSLLLTEGAATELESRFALLAPKNGSLPERLARLAQLREQDSRVSDFIVELEGWHDPPEKLIASSEQMPLSATVVWPREMQPYVVDFLDVLIRDLNVTSNITFQLPTGLFRSDCADFNLRVPHQITDLTAIAFDDSGRRLTLIDDKPAFDKLRKAGIYERGDFRITFSWFPGKDKIRLWRKVGWAEVFYQWLVQVPSVLIGREEPSLVSAVTQFVIGAGVTLNRLFGIIPTKVRKHSDKHIKREVSNSYISWLKDNKGFSVTGLEVVRWEHPHGVPTLAFGEQIYPVILAHPTRGTLDLRTQIPCIRAPLSQYLSGARQRAGQRLGPKRMTMINTQSQSVGREMAVSNYLKAWHEAYLDEISSQSHAIDALSTLPGLTSAVLKEEQARFLLAPIVQQKASNSQKAIESAVDQWIGSHPIKSVNKKFLNNARKAVADRIRSKENDDYDNDSLGKLLDAEMTRDIALLMETQRDFKRSEARFVLAKQLIAERTATIVEIPVLKLPRSWDVERVETALGGVTYQLKMSRTIKIWSTIPLWRLMVFASRFVAFIWNGTFSLTREAFIGVRRWDLSREDFSVRLAQLDGEGRFRSHNLRTLRGRLAAVHRWRKEKMRQVHESEHIIRLREGVYVDTCWAHFWTATAVSIADASIIGFAVVESTARVAALGLGLVTSPAWSLLGNLGYSLYNAVCYDNDIEYNAADKETSNGGRTYADGIQLPEFSVNKGQIYGGGAKGPLLYNFYGVPNLFISLIRTPFHVVKGAFVGALGEARHIWNQLWHGVMTCILRRAEIPTRARGFFWATSGPGMETPFVLVDSSTAMFALLAFLSQQELGVARREALEEIEAPQKKLERKVRDDSGGAIHPSGLPVVAAAIQGVVRQNLNALEGYSALQEADKSYELLIREVRHNKNIRMKQEELEAFFAQAEPLVTKFYIGQYFPRMTAGAVTQFWDSLDLTPGDWRGLTEKTVSNVFTKEIIVPFEAASDDLVVEANQVSGLERIVSEALEEEGIVTGLSTGSRLGHPVKVAHLPKQPHYADLPVGFPPVPE